MTYIYVSFEAVIRFWLNWPNFNRSRTNARNALSVLLAFYIVLTLFSHFLCCWRPTLCSHCAHTFCAVGVLHCAHIVLTLSVLLASYIVITLCSHFLCCWRPTLCSHCAHTFCAAGVLHCAHIVLTLSGVAAFSPLANSPPAISPAANGPPAKSPPPPAKSPPPPAKSPPLAYMSITFLLIINDIICGNTRLLLYWICFHIVVLHLHGSP